MEADSLFTASSQMPFHFWSVVFFVFGAAIGSFLNVCIHRMPLGQSIVSPPSHCPHCNYAIPAYLNLPLVTWLWLRGKCANCGAPISIRYFLVELLTGVAFMGCWLRFGHQSPLLALVGCVFLSGLIVATFIDFEHFIIPDEITIGGIVVGFVCSFVLPALHFEYSPAASIKASILGMLVGAGIIYGVLRAGKLAFGRERIELSGAGRVIFSENGLILPDREIPFQDIFYRAGDVIKLHASRAELCDRCYLDVPVRLSERKLTIGDDEMNPEEVPWLEVLTDELVLPREAMGLGDVKFMAAIGAFLGWQAVIFSLFVSAMLGAVIGVGLIAARQKSLQSRLPYGPYIALAAAVWLFGGDRLWHAFWTR